MDSIVLESIKPGIEFIKGIKQDDKVAIILGHDNDSICSAALIHKLLKTRGTDSKFVMSGVNSSVSEDVIDILKKLEPAHIIIVDISDVRVDLLTEMRNMSNVLIIDHHTPKGYVKVVYVNPRIFDKQLYIPATYLCYRIYEKFSDPKGVMWIAGIGTLSDMGLKFCESLFNEIKKNFYELVDENPNIDEILFDKSVLGTLSKTFNSARVVDGMDGAQIALDVIVKSKSYKDVLDGKGDANKLLQWNKTSEKEFKELLKDYEKKKKVFGKYVMYEIKSKLNMKSPLSSYLAKTLATEVLVILQKKEKFIDVSFRRGRVSIMDLDRLAKMSMNGIPDSNGGGHIQASGGRFPAKYLEKFIKNLKSIK